MARVNELPGLLRRGGVARTSIGLLLASSALLGCEAALTGSSSERQGSEVGEGGKGSEPAVKPALPGFSVIRRLSRDEYQRTVEDLLGTQLRPTESFPADNLGDEFATVGAALSLSPIYVISYERAAHELTTELFERTGPERDAILFCDVAAEGASNCAQDIVAAFARSAFRRPLKPGEVEGLMGPVRLAAELGASPEDGLRHSLTAVLLSPHFLFKVEEDDEPDSGKSRRLNSHEVATRLSYALWGTMPDKALFTRADAGELESDASVREEIQRMLRDEKAEGLLDNFAARWLGYADLEAHEVEATVFPEYTPELARSMKAEAKAFVAEFLSSDLPAHEMLRAQFTFVDQSLADHYGLPMPSAPLGDNGLARVSTAGSTRGGLLTLGAVLLGTSFSARTSPVKRGEFVFDRILCGEVPPPPPGVEGFPSDTEGLSQRERLELHRVDPSCSSCHSVMDPLGFGLEGYDAIGSYREMDGASPVNASGELPDGRTFNGALELGVVLADDPRFAECLTHKFMTYALGRLFSGKDQWLAYLSEAALESRGPLSETLENVLVSDAFRGRQAGPTKK